MTFLSYELRRREHRGRILFEINNMGTIVRLIPNCDSHLIMILCAGVPMHVPWYVLDWTSRPDIKLTAVCDL